MIENDKLMIIIDSREKNSNLFLKVLNEKNIKWVIRKMAYGDYSFEYDGKSFEKSICIEKKELTYRIVWVYMPR